MKTYPVTGDPKTLTPLDVNARFMRHEQFQRLVANLRDDGTLSSTPFVWRATAYEADGETPTGYPEGALVILSGNHRTLASIEAGLEEITWLQCDEYLHRDQRLSIQLSHNALAGQDDPAVLAALYEEIESIDWKQYAALDDAHLDLIGDVSFDSLKPANLQFQTLALTFLPGDFEAAVEAFRDAEALTKTADERWLARYEDHFAVLRALDEVGKAHNVKNMGASLAYVLDVYRAHREDLQAGYVGEDGKAKHNSRVPIASALGTDELPAAGAITVSKALRKMQERGEVGKTDTWQAIVKWAQAYLDGK